MRCFRSGFIESGNGIFLNQGKHLGYYLKTILKTSRWIKFQEVSIQDVRAPRKASTPGESSSKHEIFYFFRF